MTEHRHGLSIADRAAMEAFRATLAAHPFTITRESFDEIMERVPPADFVEYSTSSVGGVRGVWCEPKKHRAGAAML